MSIYWQQATHMSRTDVLSSIAVIVRAGLVVTMTSDSATRHSDVVTDDDSTEQFFSSLEYQFVHDRVRQAAYELIEGDQRQIIHLLLGQLFLSAGDNDTVVYTSKRFDAANQFIKAINLIRATTDDRLRLSVAELFLDCCASGEDISAVRKRVAVRYIRTASY